MLTSIATRKGTIWCERTYPGRPRKPKPCKPIAITTFKVVPPKGYKESFAMTLALCNDTIPELAKSHNLFLIKESEDLAKREVTYRIYYRNKWNLKSFLRDWFRPKSK